MAFFNKRNMLDALKALGVMLVIDLLCLFIGTAALTDNAVIGWALFAAFLLIYFIAAYYDGSIKGENECRYGERLLNQAQRTGRPLDESERALLYSRARGAAVAFMVALPGLLMLIFALITSDGILAARMITRVYFTPFIKLFSEDLPLAYVLLIYAAGAFLYPLLYYAGYLTGPKQNEKVKEIIRKNEEDYKKGIRRRRPKPRRRRFLF